MKGLKPRIYICTIPWRCELLPTTVHQTARFGNPKITNVHRNVQPSLPKTSLYGKDFQLLLLNLTRPSQGQYLDRISFRSINPPRNPQVLTMPLQEKKNLPPSGGATPPVEFSVGQSCLSQHTINAHEKLSARTNYLPSVCLRNP